MRLCPNLNLIMHYTHSISISHSPLILLSILCWNGPRLFLEQSASRDIQHNSILLEPLSKTRILHLQENAKASPLHLSTFIHALRTSSTMYPVASEHLQAFKSQKEPREPTHCNCESSNSYPKYVLPWNWPIQLMYIKINHICALFRMLK